MTIKHVGLGAKYSGRCAVCGGDTGSRWFELAATALYRGESGYRVAHPICAGGDVKSKVGGGSKYRREPAAELEVSA